MTPPVELQTPSPASLAKTTALAVVAAAMLLVTVVLPAEYAIDPLGVGRRLGLTTIATPRVPHVERVSPEGALLVPLGKGPIGEYPAAYKVDVVEIVLGPYEYVEYKYHLEQGATMLFAWTSTGPLVHDLHAERAGGAQAGAAAEESFDKQDRQGANGSYTAPFAGIHGWYWENTGGTPITIRLTSAGFYSSAVEIRSDRSRHRHILGTPDTVKSERAPQGPSGSGT
ncbi:MAG: hypothetical protein ABIX28_12755 [Vicinamibacterales bacterium]